MAWASAPTVWWRLLCRSTFVAAAQTTLKNLREFFFSLERPSKPTGNFFSHWNDPQNLREIFFLVGTTLQTNEKFYFLVGTTLRPTKKYIFALKRPSRPTRKYIFLTYVALRQRKKNLVLTQMLLLLLFEGALLSGTIHEVFECGIDVEQLKQQQANERADGKHHGNEVGG